MEKTINSDLIRGNINTIILKSLYNGDRYGYDIIKDIEEEISKIKVGDGNYCKKRTLLDAMILSCKAVIRYANRYAKKAREMAEKESNSTRKAELLKIAATCERVPELKVEQTKSFDKLLGSFLRQIQALFHSFQQFLKVRRV